MAVPPINNFILPVLRIVGESEQDVHRRALVTLVCDALGISAEDRKEQIPSQLRTKVVSRTNWASTFLVRSGLLSRPNRGYLRITDAGEKILQKNLKEITIRYLREISPEFDKFMTGSSKTPSKSEGKDTDESNDNFGSSPDERIEEALGKIKASLQGDLIDRIQNLTAKAFEQLILDLMLRMDYGDVEASERTGQSGDGGIDGIIRDSRLGLDPIYLQAKRYARDNHVGVGDVNSFIGAVDRKGNKGVFVTTSSFSKPAIEAVKEAQKEIRLIDGDELTKLMMRYKLGVRVEETLTIKKLDSDYFDELDEK